MTPVRLLAAVAAAAAVAACGAGGASSDGAGCEWIYAATTEMERLDLFAYRDGEHVQLTDDAASSHPTLSPDGETIAFVRGTGEWMECCGYEGHELWTRGADGSDAAPLMTEGDPTAPAWSPDGERIAYLDVLDDGGGSVLTTIDMSSGERRTVREAPLSGTFEPVWSPDGTELAWADQSTGEISRVDVADGAETVVEIRAEHEMDIDSAIAWASDGEAFLVSGYESGDQENAEWRLLRVDADTGEATELAEDVQLPVALDDGRIAGMVMESGEDGELVVMEADGSGASTAAALPIAFPYNGIRVEAVAC